MPERVPVVRQLLLSAAMGGETSVERFEVVRIELAPAQEAGLHRHPCPVVGYVVAGAIRFQVAGEPEVTLGAGDAFFEPANAEIAHFDNESDQAPATFVAFYLLPHGDERRIEML